MKADPTTTQASEFLHRTDFELALAAKDAIELLAPAPKGAVRVTVRDGWVSLAGKAEDGSQKGAAEIVVRNLPRVRGVHNLITIPSQSNLSLPVLSGKNGVCYERAQRPI
jgi:osmotically-inducible protein OsmY